MDRRYINQDTVDSRSLQRGNFGTATGTVPNINKEKMKPLKRIDGGVGLAADGDPIEGFLVTFNAALDLGGLPYCSYQDEGHVLATIVASGTHVAINDCVIAATNANLGTANASVTGDPQYGTVTCVPIVKKEASPAAGIKYWKVVDLRGGSGADGTLITIRYE
jgi:hypothetical protein